MAIDFSDLAIRVNYTDVDKATKSLEGLAQAGNKAEQATNRIGVASVSATRGMGAWDAIQAEAAGHVGEHSIAIGRLERGFASIVGHAFGANSAVESLVAGLLKFSVGTLESVGVLAGLAAVVGLYDLMTEGARKASAEADKVTQSLVDQTRAAVAATQAGADNLKMIQEFQQQAVQKESGIGWRSILGGILTGNPNFISGTDADNQARRLANAQTAVDRATTNSTDIWKKAEDEKTRKMEEEERKRIGLIHRRQEAEMAFRELMARTYGDLGEHGHDFSGGPIAQQLRDAQENSLPSVLKVLQGLTSTATGNASMPSVGVNDGLTPTQIKQRRAMGIGVGGGGVGDQIGQQLQDAFSPTGLALSVVSSGINYIISGFTDMATSMLDGGAAAEQYAREVKRTRDEYAASFASFQKNDLGAEIAQIALAADGLIQSLHDMNDVFTIVKGGASAVNKAIADKAAIDAQEQRNKALAEKQAVDKAGDALEDLVIRNLRATGQGSAADRQAYQEAQAREYRDAVDKAMIDGVLTLAEQTYLNTLKTTENNELLAFLNGTLQDATRNSPTGFFASAYYSQFATPRESDPFGTGMPSPNSPAGTGAASGSGLRPPGSRGATQTINVVLPNGKVLASVVVGELDQHAGATGGAGTSRSDALNRYPA